MKRITTAIFLTLICAQSFGQDIYKYSIDLINVSNDRVKVVLQCPKIKETSALFVMPYVIPGSYAWKEYGRFLDDVKGYDANGKPIKIKRKKNLFYIKSNADKLARIEYFVNDTWDDKDQKKFVFQPGGSNIEANKNFVINHHAFEGYFEGYKNIPFEVEVNHPESMYGSTWSHKERIDSKKDLIKAGSYFELVDNPVMYCAADTASFLLDTTRIHIAAFSTNKLIRADSIREWLKPLAVSLRSFIGKLPVKDYYFIYYFSADDISHFHGKSGLSGYGALEHHHCSFYFLQELKNSESAKEMVQDVGAHEFLHILTPLNLHSKEISDFNFKDPKMSQHLWLYEGVTEYFSWLSRLHSHLVTEDDFFSEMKDKLENTDTYGSFSFTEMSTNVLKPEFQEKYSDVYQKGAIMAMMLDQLLLKKSGGSFGLVHLVKKLMAKYGSQNPFDDKNLFNEIADMSYPEAGEFLNRFVKGSAELPVTEYMNWFGYKYAAAETVLCYYIGYFSCRINGDDNLVVEKVDGSNIGLQAGDVILEVNGIKIGRKNFSSVWEKYFKYNTSPDNMTFTMLVNGNKVIKKGTPLGNNVTRRHTFEKKDTTQEIKVLRDAWLQGVYTTK